MTLGTRFRFFGALTSLTTGSLQALSIKLAHRQITILFTA